MIICSPAGLSARELSFPLGLSEPSFAAPEPVSYYISGAHFLLLPVASVHRPADAMTIVNMAINVAIC